MVREIVKDSIVLSQKSKTIKADSRQVLQIIQDLIETALEHDTCVGLAAIQIGEPYRVIIAKTKVKGEEFFMPFINPVITATFGEKYEAEEGCLSLDGKRKVMRYEGIEVMHQRGKKFIKQKFSGYLAEILQHEIDHTNGKLI